MDSRLADHGPAPCGFDRTQRSFSGDLRRLAVLLEQRTPFAFARFNDGEWRILCNGPIDNGEFSYDPASPIDQHARRQLLSAFRYRNERYLVGISCVCCCPKQRVAGQRFTSGQVETQLTWANIWANSNYPLFQRLIIPQFGRYARTYLICNERANVNRLPFRVGQAFRVGGSAFRNHSGVLAELLGVVSDESLRGALFLVGCGPFGKTLIHQMQQSNPLNTYLDIGSALDPCLFDHRESFWRRLPAWIGNRSSITRGYHKPGRKRRKTCVWWTPGSDDEQRDLAELEFQRVNALPDLRCEVAGVPLRDLRRSA